MKKEDRFSFGSNLVSKLGVLLFVFCGVLGCKNEPKPQSVTTTGMSAEMILGNPNYPAISYGGYRTTSRDDQPSIEQIKNDLRILHAMGIRLLRTYNLQFEHTPNLLKAIEAIQNEDPQFEMYVMLGTWMDCKDAWSTKPIHTEENVENNASEIKKAVALANRYPDIIKIISVGNEAMVHWAAAYYVTPNLILKWVRHLQDLKHKGVLPADLWITSSDNFASWGGGDSSYHLDSLTELIKAVDYLSIHTYPFHDTHYNPTFWEVEEDTGTTKKEQIALAMDRAVAYSIQQYKNVKGYLDSLGIQKPIHIGETGWSTKSTGLYGASGSQAADEYKQALYFDKSIAWTQEKNITMVFFSAFDEIWKDPNGANASENNFGLFTVDGKAKYALWKLVDQGFFNNLSREEKGNAIIKTYGGNEKTLLAESKPPKIKE